MEECLRIPHPKSQKDVPMYSNANCKGWTCTESHEVSPVQLRVHVEAISMCRCEKNKVTIVATYSKYKQAAAAYMSTSCAHTSCYFNTNSQIALQTFEYTENMPGS